MRYELMLPHQIRTAIDGRWPIVLPLGVLEYHGEHMAVGMDTLAVVKSLELLEREMDLVILPTFYYGAASYAVEPPERNGTLHIDAEKLLGVAQDLFAGLLRIGFRNMYVIVHHQTENFAAGMPTDLAFKFAARQAIFAFLEKQRGEGWWGRADMSEYYADHESGRDPFNWIKVHPLMSKETTRAYPFDHAGRGETSLMMAMCPEAVDLARVSAEKWYTRSAQESSVAFGERGRDLILADLRRVLAPDE
jgi:creatinine amidohydrolase/Fe(II)-dependent formamide hydrolase-like protein